MTRAGRRNVLAGATRGFDRRISWLAGTALASAVMAGGFSALANPTGGQVVAGGASIAQPNRTTVTVTQSTENAAINWQGFSIANGETTQFVQPNASATTLNRVVGPDPSTIAGTLKANGAIILVNPSGIVFSKGSQVDVNGLVATTSDIANSDYMAGNLKFDVAPASPNATVVNKGKITVGQAGLAALVAPGVANSGVINAKLGKVVLAGAETFTVDLYGDGLVTLDASSKVQQVPVTINGKAATALVSNTGQISADGGHILLTADAAYGIVSDLVSAGGTLQAQTVVSKTGVVTTGEVDVAGGGGGVTVGGTVDVSGPKIGAVAGTATVTGAAVILTKTAKINASGAGGGGTVKIGGGLHGTDTSIANAQTTTVAAGATIDVSATGAGNGGTVTVWSDQTTSFDGAILAQGGALGGNGGSVETSGGKLAVGANASVNTLAAKGATGIWLLDPTNFDIGVNIPASTLVTNLNTSDQAYSADNNLTVSAAIDSSANTNSHNLTLEAGNSILINANITLKGSLTATANDHTDLGMALADRGVGAGNLTMASGTTIDTTAGGATATVSLGINGFAANTAAPTPGGDFTQGALTLGAVNTSTLAVATTAAVSLSGNLTLSGVSGLDLSGTSGETLTAALTIDTSAGNGPIKLATITGGANSLTLSSGSGGQTLAGITTSGNLTLTTTGVVTLDAGSYTITGGASPYVFPAVTTNGTLTLGQATNFGAVTLGGATTVNSTNTAIDFTSTVDGAQGLTVNAGTGAVTFGGVVGGTTALTSLTVTGPTTLAGNVTTSGAQTYNSAVTLGGTDTLTTTNAAVDFVGTVDGAQALTVAAGIGAVTFGGAVGGAASLSSLTVTGPTTLDANVTTSGTQTYNSAVTLGGTDTLTTTNTAVDFVGTVDGAQALTVAAGTGAVTFGGVVGGAASLSSLTVTGPTTLGGNVTTSGTQIYNSAVTLGGNDTLTTTNAAVDFVGTVDGAQALTVAAGTGTVTFGGSVGGATALSSLTVTGPTTLGGNVTTSEAQIYNSAVTLGGTDTLTTTNAAIDFVGQITGGANSLTLSSGSGGQTLAGITTSGNLTLTTTGLVTLDAGSYTITGGASPYVFPAVTTNGTLTLGQATNFGAVTLGGATTVNSTNTAIDFTSTVDGAQGLTVNAGTGAVTFGGAVGGTTALTSLTVTGPTTLAGNVTTSGAQTYNSAVTLGGTDTLTTTNAAVDFVGTVDGAQALTVAAGIGAVTFGGAVGGAASLSSLTVTGPTTLGGNVTTSGTQTYNSAVTLGANDTLTTTNAAVDFVGTVDGAQALTVAAGTGAVTFGGVVGGATALSSLTVTGPTTLDANVTTSGAQTYNSAVTLGGNDTLTTANAAVDFVGTVDGAQALTVAAGAGTVTFGGVVGGAASLSSLTVTGPTTLGGNVTTSEAQIYNSPVTLGGTDTLTTTNAAIDFVGQITGGANSLTLSSGSGGQTLAGITTSGNLTLTTTGVVTLDAGSYTITGGASPYVFPAVTTNGTLTLGQATNFGAVTLGGATTVNSTNTAIDFTSTVDGAQGLTVNAGTGAVTFGGAVGGTTALTSLTVTGPTTLAGNVTTSGAQTYNSAVMLGGTDTLTTTNAAVDFVGTVDGTTAATQGLTVTAGTGIVTFGGAVGGTTSLASLAVTGPTTLDRNVTTSGAQSYDSAVTLGGTDTLTTTNAAVDFTGTVDGTTAATQALTVAAGTGAVTFGGAIGGSTSLSSLTLTGPTTLDGNVTTSGAQTYNSAVTLGGTDTLTTANATVDFVGTVNGTTAAMQGLTVAAGTGAVTFGGVVGGTTSLSSLAVTGPTTLDRNVTTSGAQTYDSAVTLGGTDTLTTGATVTFVASVGGAYLLNVTGNAVFHGITTSGVTVSGTDTLDTGTYTIASFGAVTTNGTLTFDQATSFGAVALASTTTFDSSAFNGALSLGTVTGGGNNLTLKTGSASIVLPAMTGIDMLTINAGSIGETGAVDASGASSFTATATNGGINLATQTNVLGGALTLTTSGTAGNASVRNSGGTLLAASVVDGALSVEDMTGSIGESGVLTVTGTSSFKTDGPNQTIALNTQTNVLGGALTLTTSGTAGNASVRNSGGTLLGASIVDGALSVEDMTGGIGESGVLTVTGTSSFKTDGPNQTIALNTQTNVLGGALTLRTSGTAGNASVRNSGGTLLAASVVDGALSVEDMTGSIGETGVLTVTGTSSFKTDGPNQTIALNTQTNVLGGALTLTTSGTTGNASVRNSGGTLLAASVVDGALSVEDMTGGIGESGVLTVTGTSSFKTDGANQTIALNTQTNVLGGALTLRTSGTAGNASVRNSGGTLLAASVVDGALSVEDMTGGIGESGVLTVTGASSFKTDGPNQTIALNTQTNVLGGALTLTTSGTTGNASVRNSGGTLLAASVVDGALSVEDMTGSIGESGVLTVTGTSSFKTDGPNQTIALNTQTNVLGGALTLTTSGTAGNASVRNSGGTLLAASIVDGALSVEDMTGSIGESGVLTVTGTSSFKTDGSNQTIALNTQTNVLGGALTLTTSGTAGNASVRNSGGTLLAASVVDGALSVEDMTGGIGESGVLTVTGTSSFKTDGPNQTIALNTQTNVLGGALTLTTFGTTGNASVRNSGGTLLAASVVDGALSVEDTTGGIGESGVLTVTGTSSFKTDGPNQTIALNTQTNVLGGALTLTTSGTTGNASVRNSGGTLLAASIVDGALSVEDMTGGIGESGVLTVTGTSSFKTDGPNQTIALNTQTNVLGGALTLTTFGTTGNASVRNSGGTLLAASVVDGALSVEDTTGGIGESGVLTVTGTSSFKTDGPNQTIALNTQTNVLGGALTLTTSGTAGNASVRNSGGTLLAASIVDGALSVEDMTGGIGETGVLTVTGTSSFKTDGPNQTIGLATSTNVLGGAITLSTAGTAGNASVRNSGGTLLAASVVDGALSVEDTTGGIGETGVLTVTGASSFKTDGPNQTIGLATSTNVLGGALTLTTSGTAGNASVRNSGGTLLAASVVDGALSVEDMTGGIGESGVLTVTGTSSFKTDGANQTIALNTQTNVLGGALTLTTFGTTGNASVRNSGGTLLAASVVDGALSVEDTTGGIGESGVLTVTGTSSFKTDGANQTIALNTQTNVLGGALTLTTFGTTGNASVRNSGGTLLAASVVDGALSVEDTTGGIGESGVLTVTGTSSFKTDGANQTIALNTQTNVLGGALTLTTFGTTGNASVRNSGGTLLAASVVDGALSVEDTTGGIGESGVLTVTGTSSFKTDGANQTIALNTQTNVLGGALTLRTSGTAGNASVRNSGGTLLAASVVDGALSVEDMTGGIGESGVLTVTGASSFKTDGANQTIALNTQTNVLGGALTLTTSGTAGNASVRNSGGTLLAASVVDGALSVEDMTGSIGESGVLTVTGTSSFKTEGASASITLTGANPLAGAVTLETGSGGPASLTDADALSVGGTVGGLATLSAPSIAFAALSAGSLSATATTGNITQGGVVTVAGTSSFTTEGAAASITLTGANPLAGAVTLETGSGGLASLTDADALSVGGTVGGLATLSAPSIAFAALSAGSLAATATTGNITQGGVVTVAGTSSFTTEGAASSITLTGANPLAGAVTLETGSGGLASLTDADALSVGGTVGGLATLSAPSIAFAALSAGSLAATATTGNITQSGVVTVAGTSSFTTEGAAASITLTGANPLAGAVTLETGSGGLASLTDADALSVGGTVGGLATLSAPSIAFAALSAGSLAATAATGNITQGGVVTVAGASSFTTEGPASSITLTGANPLAGAVTLETGSGGLASLTDSDALSVGGTVGGLATLSAPSIAFAALSAGSLAATAATGNITQSGVVTVAGASSFTTEGAASSITLTGANPLAGAVTLETGSGGLASLTDSDALSVGGTVGGLATLSAPSIAFAALSAGSLAAAATTGNITQSGLVTVAGTSSFTTEGASASITLTGANPLAGAVTLETGSGGLASLTDSDALSVGGTVGGLATLSAPSIAFAALSAGSLAAAATTGNITQSGLVTVAGTSSFTTEGASASITLTGANPLAGAVTLETGSGGLASLTDSDALSVGGTVGGLATLSAPSIAFAALSAGSLSATATTGNITQGGLVTVAGASSFTTEGASASITLTGANPLAGAVTLETGSGGLASLTDSDALSVGGTVGGLATLSAPSIAFAALSAGSLSATATTGNITQGGVVTVAGTSSFTTEGAAASITLTGANPLAGAVTLETGSGGLASLTDADALSVGGTVGGLATLSAPSIAFAALSAGSLAATATTGNITQGGVVTVAGTSSFTTEGAASSITLTGANPLAGAVTLETGSGGLASLTDADALSVGGTVGGLATLSAPSIAFAALSAGSLAATATTGNITQSGVVTVAGTSSFTTEGAAASITLTGANPLAGAVTLETGSGGLASLTDSDALSVGGTVGGLATLSAPSIAFAALSAGSLAATATTGNITQSGVLTVTGTSSFTTEGPGASITLNTQTNALAGAVTLNAVGGASLTNSVAGTGTILAASTIGGNLTVTGLDGFGITETGILTVAGTSSFADAVAGAQINLGTSANALTGAITLNNGSSTGSVQLKNSIAGTGTVLAASTAGGNLTVTATGPLTIDGPASAGGSATFLAGGALKVSAPITATIGDVVLEAPSGAVTVSSPLTAGHYILIGGENFLQAAGTALTFTSELTVVDVIAGDQYVANAVPPPRNSTYTTNLAEFVSSFASLTRVGKTIPATPPVIMFATLNNPGTLILIGNQAIISDTGQIDVGKLAVIASGGSANLGGVINNISGQGAPSNLENAQAYIVANGVPSTSNNNFKFNACSIGSPTCVVVPILVPPPPTFIDTFDFITRAPFDDIDIERLNTGQEDVY